MNLRLRRVGDSGQPRPQLGFFPWFAFFFLDSLRFVVLLDTK